MKEFIKDIQYIVVKHWGKLIVVGLIIVFIFNLNDFKEGFNEGWNSAKDEKTK